MYLFSFLFYVFVTTFTPGPNNIMAMSNANKYGLRKTVKFTLGVAAGFLIIMLICSYFNLFLHSFIPKIGLAMSILGAIYMIYLALKIIMSKPHGADRQDEKENSFLTGLVLQFINPKVILYGITAISTFIIPNYTSNISLILFSFFLAIVGFLGTFCWAIFGAFFQKFLSKYSLPFNIMMGVLLIYSAVSIFI